MRGHSKGRCTAATHGLKPPLKIRLTSDPSGYARTHAAPNRMEKAIGSLLWFLLLILSFLLLLPLLLFLWWYRCCWQRGISSVTIVVIAIFIVDITLLHL